LLLFLSFFGCFALFAIYTISKAKAADKKNREFIKNLAQDLNLIHVPKEDPGMESAVSQIQSLTISQHDRTRPEDCLISRDPDYMFHLCSAKISSSSTRHGETDTQGAFNDSLILNVPVETSIPGVIHVRLRLDNLSETLIAGLLGTQKMPDPVDGFEDSYVACAYGGTNLALLPREVQRVLLERRKFYPFGDYSRQNRAVGLNQDLLIGPNCFSLRGVRTSSTGDVQDLLKTGQELKEALIKSGAGKAVQPGSSSQDVDRGDDGIYRVDI